MNDLEARELARQISLFGDNGLTALESARLASSAARAPGPVTLRPYQVGAVESFLAAIARGKRRLLVNLPTGTGKTVFGFALAKRLGHRVCWLAHRDELLRQPLETAARVWPEVSRGLVKASQNEGAAHVVVASVQTLGRPGRLEQLNGAGEFGLVVVDECHHVASDQYRRVLDGLGCFREGGPPTLGLTATLERADGIGLGAVFEEISYQLGLHEAIDKGYLSPFRGVQVELPLRADVRALVETLIGRRAKRPRGYEEEDDQEDETPDAESEKAKAERALLFQGVAEATAHAVVEHASDRKTIVFTCTIDQARRTADELAKLGMRAEHASGEMPLRDRQAVLERFKSGQTRVVCNASLLVEGFDEPSVDCIVMAKPTRSRSVYVQAVGRGLRLYPGKRDCLVLDVVFASHLGLQTAATLANTEATTLFTGGGRALSDRDPEEREAEEEKRVLATAAASLGEGVAMDGRQNRVEGPRWLSVSPTCWALSLWPQGVLVVDRLPLEENADGSLFEAFVMPPKGASQRVSEPGAFEWVFGVAEDFMRSSAGHALAGSPKWRRAPVSQGQLAELARRGLPMVRTAGDAADQLTVSTVRARLGY